MLYQLSHQRPYIPSQAAHNPSLDVRLIARQFMGPTAWYYCVKQGTDTPFQLY